MRPNFINNLLTGIFTIAIISALVLGTGSITAQLYLNTPRELFATHINRLWPYIPPSPTPPSVLNPEPTPPTHIQPPSQSQVQSSQIQLSKISESDLWNGLVVYRNTHNRNPLVSEESLCAYGRKRVAEHQERIKNLSEGESPLDNHSGFQRDADSESLFRDTGFSNVAEVLAYLPNAQNATQVIEWGWDSSPAHREGLLSNDSTHACIVGTSPFYVGILANR